MRRLAILLPILCLALGGAARAQTPTLVETPYFTDAVDAARLPPVAQRVPEEPLVETPTLPGKPGGELRLLMAGAKDTRMMVVYGYARLVRYNSAYKLEPDIAKAVDDDGDRVFTFHLRKGQKWSDGKPFTAEDFRYWFEDVASNKSLYPNGLPDQLVVDGKGPKFEVLDPETVRYSWDEPNALFLPALASPDPLYIYGPAHYLKRFNAKYADANVLSALIKEYRVRNWAALHTRLFHPYHNDNPELPTLDPWVLQTKPPSERFVFERNPYYFAIDPAGHQLPYIDKVTMTIADAKIIPAKTGAGESDLQARYLRFDNYTFLKDAEDHNDYTVRLWRTAPGAQVALYPNLNYDDPAWRNLLRDVRFRRALSLAIDRQEINQVIYYGLAVNGQNTVLPGSPLYKPEYREEWANYDPKEANKLLDELGLTKRDSDGTRLLPDGRPLEIVVENAGDSSEQSDVLELIRDSWAEIGVRLFAKPSQLEIWLRRVYAGSTMMSIDKGYDNGLPSANMPPIEFTPTNQRQLQWPKWGQYVETKGKAGEAIDLPAAEQLRQLYLDWFKTRSEDERAEIWAKILDIQADQVFTIGVVAGVMQPVVVSNKLRNVPREGIYNWDPGAFFGIYHPDTFWLAPDGTNEAAQAQSHG
ncbi:MAG TPA: ABC transporter substrate-binding protein [Stellaceae bacterium]|nr:ABC transporter substrate-binding protein [Stellaceae bacterium]